MLNQAQQSAVEIGLRQLERDLAWVEQLLGWTYQGVMFSFVNDLAETTRAELQRRLDEARRRILALRDRLDLRPETITKSCWIAGEAVHLWVLTEEGKSRYLHGYGQVDPRLPALLDPTMTELGDVMLDLQSIARTARGRPGDDRSVGATGAGAKR
jgi:hypothetical protein